MAGVLVGLTLLGMAFPGSLAAQDASCEFLEGTENFNLITLAGGATITYLSNPRIGCPDGVRIVADSAITYSAQDLTHLLGSVVFRDGTRELQAQEARYFPSTGRLQATRDVRLENAEDGSVIENGDLVLLRETDFRDRDELTVTTGADRVRPRATLFLRPAPDTASVLPDTASVLPDTASVLPDTASVLRDTVPAVPDTTPPTPYVVVGDRLHLVGQGYFEATGNVEIDRDSIHATAQRAEYDEAVGELVLQGGARLEGAAYDLEGQEILLELPGGEIGQVTARRDGVLTGEDLRLDAPVIHLFLVDELLDRIVAVPIEGAVVDTMAAPDSALLARPVARAEEFVLTADSVDVRAPAQALDRIYAVGAARGESTARDSLNVEGLPEIARRDWLEGDTIIATFRPARTPPRIVDPELRELAPTDSVREAADPGPPAEPEPTEAAGAEDEYVLDELVASGSARSLYRLLPSDSTSRPGVDPPAVHYVMGNRITIVLLGGEVDHMDVQGRTRGYHLEPLPPTPATGDVSDTLPPPGSPPADTVPVAGRAGPDEAPTESGPSPRLPPPPPGGGDASQPLPGTDRGRWSP